jgi:hypothetical protein
MTWRRADFDELGRIAGWDFDELSRIAVRQAVASAWPHAARDSWAPVGRRSGASAETREIVANKIMASKNPTPAPLPQRHGVVPPLASSRIGVVVRLDVVWP